MLQGWSSRLQICYGKVHTMDTAESSLNAKGKGGEKAVGSNPRAKATNWPTAISEFLLDWYIEKKLAMPPNTSFKKLHHTSCTSTVNSKYGTTYTVDQVHHHWKRHKDTWGLVTKHLHESSGGSDDSTKMVTLSQSTLNDLSANDRGILSKPFSSLTSCKNYSVVPQLMVHLCKILPL
ncbi:uncharacterized protein LOC133891959 [Phragmites australis]|uniref:uncharacterized protein LOC133891959 n=1 Tax=Phragmites australis TaxID=29695 RepID=UPI002D772C18|nr:uncharacterized protein LOC133891959 [Phragmites australis]